MKTNKKNFSKPTFNEEKILWEKGFKYIVGIDEVGRGAFAGPIVAGAVVFDTTCKKALLKDVNDSKQLKFMQRKRLSKIIKDECLYWEINAVPVSVINKIGIGKANKVAFRKALSGIVKRIDPKDLFVLVDGFHVRYIRGVGLEREKAIIKGDQKSFSIAAASIIAKDYRDRVMKNLSKKYPEYGFGRNKGYGTKEHQAAIKKHGLTMVHRKSFNLARFV